MTPNVTAAVAWGLIELRHSDIYEHAERLAEAKRKIRQELAAHGLRLLNAGWARYRLESSVAYSHPDRGFGTLEECCQAAMRFIAEKNQGRDAA